MKLGEYLKAREIPRQDFARRVGVSETYLCRLISGERTPGGKTLFRIETETGHVVGGADFFEPMEAAE